MVKLHIISSRCRIKNRRVCGRLKDLHDYAFTIVELLIVIVVIGILAAITIILYRGITQRATEATLQADLSNASKKIKLYFADHGVYPTTMDPDGNGNYCPTGPVDNNYCIKPSNGGAFSYSLLSGGQDFSLISTKGTVSYRTTRDGVINIWVLAESFAKTVGGSGYEYGRSIVKTNDNGFVIAGFTSSFGAGSVDAFISRYDINGNLVWFKTWGGTADEYCYGVIQTNDGGYAMTGFTTSYGAGSYDMFLNKFNSSGDLVWNKTWGGTGIDDGHGLTQLSDGSYVVVGSTSSWGVGSYDSYITKFNSNGVLLWSATWGGASSDIGKGVVPTSDGGYVVTGYTQSFGSGNFDIFLAKYNSAGNLAWSKTWGGANVEAYNNFNPIIKTSDNGYLIAGYTSSFGAGGSDMLLIKYDINGNLLWNKTWGGAGADMGYGLVQANDGGYAVTGNTASYGAGSDDLFLAKFDSSGSFSWNKTWGSAGSEYGHSIIQNGDGSYFLTGNTPNYGAGIDDILMLKIKSDGTINNCVSPMCQTPSATITNPSATVTTPSPSNTNPDTLVVITTPSATITSPSATVTTVVTP